MTVRRETIVAAGVSPGEQLGCADGRLDALARRRFFGRRRRGLTELLEAFLYASDVGRGVWDFAVELKSLETAGLTRSDLRWMVCRTYVQHAREVTPSDEDSRCFRRSARLRFCGRSCFVLTPSGVEFARSALRRRVAALQSGICGCAENGDPEGRALERPQWDRDRQELRVGSIVVKQFKVPAVNQEKVLAAFEEENWPVRIDDPLPPQPDQDSKRRLHDTVNSLNRNQKQPLIRFYGDGSGEGICWEHSLAGDDGRRIPRSPR